MSSIEIENIFIVPFTVSRVLNNGSINFEPQLKSSRSEKIEKPMRHSIFFESSHNFLIQELKFVIPGAGVLLKSFHFLTDFFCSVSSTSLVWFMSLYPFSHYECFLMFNFLLLLCSVLTKEVLKHRGGEGRQECHARLRIWCLFEEIIFELN